MNVGSDPRGFEAAERAVAIGTFDGVHRGHRAVIEAAVATGLRSGVVTFDPHPRLVLGYGVQLLAPTSRRLELIGEIGPDDVLVLPFTPELARRSADEFVGEVLAPLGTRIAFVGENFRFGSGRGGDAETLTRHGIEVRSVELVPGVSSSVIRGLIAEGAVEQAALLLGRPFELEGPVVSGDQRGTTLGFPTANLALPAHAAVPGYGIYAGAATFDGSPEWFRVAMSIGVNPHYGGNERRIEAFLLDFSGDLYGRTLRVEVWQRLRGEQAFASEAALVDQIAQDVAQARSAARPGGGRAGGDRSAGANC